MRHLFRMFPKGEHSEFFELNDNDIQLCTGRQRSYIYGLLDRSQMDEEELIDLINPYAESIKSFTKKDASDAIEYLKGIVY